MSISVFCLRCANVFNVKDSKAGKLVPCPRCGVMSKAPAGPPKEADTSPTVLYRVSQWILNGIFIAILVYLYHGGGLTHTFQAWFNDICRFLKH